MRHFAPAASLAHDYISRTGASMPYDVTIITVKPNTHMKALPGVEQWLKANPRKGEFIGCLTAEIGDLNQILLLHNYANEADLAADRDAVAKDANPYGCLALTDGRTSDTFTQFPFLPPIKPGQYGPGSRFAPICSSPTACRRPSPPGRSRRRCA